MLITPSFPCIVSMVTASRRRFVKSSVQYTPSHHFLLQVDHKQRVCMPPSHSACHTKFNPCVASLPGYSERLGSEKNTTHLVYSDLLEHAMVRKSRCESTGRCTGCEFGGEKRHTSCPPAKRFLPTKTAAFPVLAG